MRRRDLLRLLLAAPPVAWLQPWMPPALGGAAVEDANAAAVYQKAFAWAETLRPEFRNRLREAATRPIDGRIVEDLIRDAQPALKAIREADAIASCRWNSEVLLPEDLGKGRLSVWNDNVIRVACLSARRHARLGQGREAVGELFASLTFAHRIGTGGVLFARVLECNGELAAFQTLGRILLELDDASRALLSRRLDALPPPEPASATIGPESRFILASLREKLNAAGPVIEGEHWDDFWLGKAEIVALKALTGGDRVKFLAHLDATVPAFAELARRLDLPHPDCRAALDDFAKKEQSIHPIAASLVENVWSVRYMVDRMHAIRTMLFAGLALIRDGEAAFRAISDPFGTGAFGLERGGKNGFLIRSGLVVESKPEVSLQIGEPS